MFSHSKYSHHGKRWYWLFLLVPVFVFGIAAVVMLLWNALIPNILHLGTISYWQAFGLIILTRILFGSFRCGQGSHQGKYTHMSHFRHKWINMSEEDRKKYKEEWKKYCSHGEPESE
jgi:hypothetical protein